MLWIRQIGRFVGWIAVQLLLINQLQIVGICHPYIYILPLLMLPVSLPRWVDMIVGMVVGLVMDIFCNALGIHMAACVAVMFLRWHVLSLWISELERFTDEINVRTIGWATLLKYVAIMILVHHTLVFALSAWTMHLWYYTLLKILVSGLVSYLLIVFVAFLYDKRSV